jgi:glycosyltransferase involved in cell wall biosynthesis
MADDLSMGSHERDRDPSVSIVVPVQPPAPTLRRVIERLLAQRYEGTVEVLVVIDDGGDIAGVPSPPSLSGTVSRALRTIANTRQPGLDGARRTGREAAQGEVVVYCAADEEWPAGRLREIVLRRFVARRRSEVPDSAGR